MRRKEPCAECPWRKDTPPGQFPEDRYAALRATAREGDSGFGPSIAAPLFACHKSTEADPLACAGWLAVEGHRHPRVRLAVASGALPAEALEPGEGWPGLWEDYDAMADAMAARGEF